MATTAHEGKAAGRLSYAFTPVGAVIVVPVVALLMLALPLRLPIGAMYWDVFVYVDAAQRIFNGQIPSIDFFGPIGPLGYYLFAAGLKFFPDAQPLLLAQWSMLPVTVPAMALVVRETARRSGAEAWALALPFLAFSLLPINTQDFSLYPGVDGFGTYNRHGSEMLYVLASALVFVRDRRTLTVILSILLPALFLSKITAFAVGGLVVAFAFAAGRIPLRSAVIVAAVFFVVIGALEYATGMITGYVGDILLLLGENSGTLVSRFVTVASQYFDVLAAAGLIVLLLFLSGLRRWRGDVRASLRSPSAWPALLDRDWAWLAVLAAAGAIFETQNTGSQAFILIWPALLAVIAGPDVFGERLRAALALLIAIAVLPTAVHFVHKAVRAAAAQPGNTRLDHENLRNLGSITAKDIFFEQAAADRAYFQSHEAGFLTGPAADPTSYRPFSDIDFQLLWLQSIDEATAAIRAEENKRNLRFDTIQSVDFVNPFPWLLDRTAPRYASLGAVPERTAHALNDAMAAELAATDLVVVPKCTATALSAKLFDLYADGFAGHARIALTPCYDAYLRPGL